VRSREKGSLGENLAVQFLQNRGFSIVERNFYAKKFGEIDVIAIKDGTLHFIEVKSTMRNFEPIYNLTSKKLKKIIDSANYYIDLKNIDMPFCISSIVVYDGKIEMLENITV
jgi:putative endonuclease